MPSEYWLLLSRLKCVRDCGRKFSPHIPNGSNCRLALHLSPSTDLGKVNGYPNLRPGGLNVSGTALRIRRCASVLVLWVNRVLFVQIQIQHTMAPCRFRAETGVLVLWASKLLPARGFSSDEQSPVQSVFPDIGGDVRWPW